MKRCDKQNTYVEFPDIERGDTVEKTTGYCYGDIYLVCRNPIDNNMMLVNLNSNGIWSTTGDMWGDSRPSDWRKVTCCFSVADEGE